MEARAAGMRYGAQSLLNKQTFLWNGEVYPAGAEFPSDAIVIPLGVISEERKMKPVFTPSRAMAGADIAARSHEDGHHIEAETDRAFGLGVFYVDGNSYYPAFAFGAQLFGCSLQRIEVTRADDDIGTFRRERGGAGFAESFTGSEDERRLSG